MPHHRVTYLPSLPIGDDARSNDVTTARDLTSSKRVLVVANPVAGSLKPRRLARIVSRLEAKGCSVNVHQTRAPGDAERLIANSDLSEVDVIAAAGGDGTFNEVLNGLPDNGPPLAILPFGTVNVLAKEIGLKASINAIADMVAFGTSRRITVGNVNGRRFALMASVGLDAIVVDKVNLTLKYRVGRLAYLYETLKQLATHRPVTYQLSINGCKQEVAGIIIANGRYYAGRYITSPTADLEKPLLDVCRLTGTGCLTPASYFLSLVLGQFAKRADVRISEASQFEILGPEGAPLQADGDILCRLPATIKVLPSAIDLIFPPPAEPHRLSRP